MIFLFVTTAVYNVSVATDFIGYLLQPFILPKTLISEAHEHAVIFEVYFESVFWFILVHLRKFPCEGLLV